MPRICKTNCCNKQPRPLPLYLLDLWELRLLSKACRRTRDICSRRNNVTQTAHLGIRGMRRGSAEFNPDLESRVYIYWVCIVPFTLKRSFENRRPTQAFVNYTNKRGKSIQNIRSLRWVRSVKLAWYSCKMSGIIDACNTLKLLNVRGRTAISIPQGSHRQQRYDFNLNWAKITR